MKDAAKKQREHHRQKGQFWTPAWVARAMVSYAIGSGASDIFDPAVGQGAFFRATKSLTCQKGKEISLSGTEIDPAALSEALDSGLSRHDILRVTLTDFLRFSPEGKFKAIVANPPYIRHHRLSAETKEYIRSMGARLLSKPLDGRAGLHIYFLLHALELLQDGGRLAFILPADTCEGVFAHALWSWITNRFRLEAVITFAPKASPFPSVDTNPIIILLSNNTPSELFDWAECLITETPQLEEWLGAFPEPPSVPDIRVTRRRVSEAVSRGLTRPPGPSNGNQPTLSDHATVLRGVATGCNDFFFLTRERAQSLSLPEEFLFPAVGRTRDVKDAALTQETLRRLDSAGRPTLLFAPDGRAYENFPAPVRRYLRSGEGLGINRKSLIATRNPWYKMETRIPPPILFTYLGRRNSRFIRNFAGAIPLTGFLCVYPNAKSSENIEELLQALNDSATLDNLRLVGKSYAGGAIKVEPRALEKLPITIGVLNKYGICAQRPPAQLTLPYGNPGDTILNSERVPGTPY